MNDFLWQSWITLNVCITTDKTLFSKHVQSRCESFCQILINQQLLRNNWKKSEESWDVCCFNQPAYLLQWDLSAQLVSCHFIFNGSVKGSFQWLKRFLLFSRLFRSISLSSNPSLCVSQCVLVHWNILWKYFSAGVFMRSCMKKNSWAFVMRYCNIQPGDKWNLNLEVR